MRPATYLLEASHTVGWSNACHALYIRGVSPERCRASPGIIAVCICCLHGAVGGDVKRIVEGGFVQGPLLDKNILTILSAERFIA